MRGHVEKNRKSSWTIVIEAGRDVNGKRKRIKKNVRVKNKTEAEAIMDQMLTELRQGTYFKPTEITVSTYLDMYKENCLENGNKKLAPGTLKRYTGIINNYLKPQLGHYKLKDLMPLHIQNHITWTRSKNNGGPGLSDESAKKHFNVLNKALRQAVDWNMIPYNPADRVDPPEIGETKEPAVLKDEQEVFKLIEVFKETILYIPVLLACTTGMRRSEILGLTWDHVDLVKGRIYVRNSLHRDKGELKLFPRVKTKSSKRTISLPPTVIEELKKHKERHENIKEELDDCLNEAEKYYKGYVCCWDDGRPISPEYVSHEFSDIAKEHGFDITFHGLRHTHNTLLLDKDVHIKKVADRGGHDIRVAIDRYSHTLPDMQDGVADVVEEVIFHPDNNHNPDDKQKEPTKDD